MAGKNIWGAHHWRCLPRLQTIQTQWQWHLGFWWFGSAIWETLLADLLLICVMLWYLTFLKWKKLWNWVRMQQYSHCLWMIYSSTPNEHLPFRRLWCTNAPRVRIWLFHQNQPTCFNMLPQSWICLFASWKMDEHLMTIWWPFDDHLMNMDISPKASSNWDSNSPELQVGPGNMERWVVAAVGACRAAATKPGDVTFLFRTNSFPKIHEHSQKSWRPCWLNKECCNWSHVSSYEFPSYHQPGTMVKASPTGGGPGSSARAPLAAPIKAFICCEVLQGLAVLVTDTCIHIFSWINKNLITHGFFHVFPRSLRPLSWTVAWCFLAFSAFSAGFFIAFWRSWSSPEPKGLSSWSNRPLQPDSLRPTKPHKNRTILAGGLFFPQCDWGFPAEVTWNKTTEYDSDHESKMTMMTIRPFFGMAKAWPVGDKEIFGPSSLVIFESEFQAEEKHDQFTKRPIFDPPSHLGTQTQRSQTQTHHATRNFSHSFGFSATLATKALLQRPFFGGITTDLNGWFWYVLVLGMLNFANKTKMKSWCL